MVASPPKSPIRPPLTAAGIAEFPPEFEPESHDGADPNTDPAAAAHRVLVADADASVRERLATALTAAGHQVDSAANAREAFQLMDQTAFDLIVADLSPTGADGMDVLRRAWAAPNAPATLALAAPAAARAAREAVRAGAHAALAKPINLEEFELAAARALDHRRLRLDNERLRRTRRRPEAMDALVGQTAPMINLRRAILTAATGDSPVLILGENGVGKELVARAIHELSARADGPFIATHCAAYPEDLLAGEVFGLRDGPGAPGAPGEHPAPQPGRLHAAAGGAFFLDEIGSLSADFQGKLLRVLAERRFYPVGSETPLPVEARLIGSTSQNFQRYLENGVFRREIFTRLRILPVMTPPLRDRRDDIPLLLAHFSARIAKRYGREPNEFTPGALGRLCERSWPGNVRELENLAEILGATHPGRRIDTEIIDAHFRNEGRRGASRAPVEIPEYGVDFNDLIDRYERDLMDEALRRAGGVKNRAAALLRLKRTTLVEKMRKKGMLD